MTSTWPPLSNLFGGCQSGPPYMNESASIARILYQDAYILAENGAGGAGGQGTAAPTGDFHCFRPGPEAFDSFADPAVHRERGYATNSTLPFAQRSQRRLVCRLRDTLVSGSVLSRD